MPAQPQYPSKRGPTLWKIRSGALSNTLRDPLLNTKHQLDQLHLRNSLKPFQISLYPPQNTGQLWLVLWWKKWHYKGFIPWQFCFPCQYYPSNVPFSLINLALALHNFSVTQFPCKVHFPLTSSRQSILATPSRNKVVPVHAMKAYRGSGVTAIIPNLGTSRRSVVSSTFKPLYLWVEVPVPTDYDHGWARFT